MKLSVVIARSSAPASAFVVWRGLEVSIKKAADFGYHGVELALKTAQDVVPLKLDRWLSQSNMQVSCISTGQVFAVLNLYFTHPEPQKRKQVIQVFDELSHLAADHGKLINVGRARGFIGENQTRDEAEALFIQTMESICENADKKGVTIIIEPVNRYEINFVNSVNDGAQILNRIDHQNIGLMPDVFHMNIEDAHIGDSLAEHSKWIKYVHLADSNRHAPGQGHLDFDDVFDGLKRARYDGWTSIEILPVPDPDTAAKQAADFLLPRVEQYSLLDVSEEQ